MANPEHVAILQQGVTRWNVWRKDKDGPSLDLSEADLRDRDLTGIDLRAVNLSKTVLRGTKVGKGSLLWNANLSGADLYGANLRGADLQDVNFTGADLFQADLRESNLQGAELSTAKGGLLSKQLAGADLTGAKLPDPLGKLYDSLSSVKEISDSAQKLFLALLAGCLYSWLTIAQTTDVELITNRASTPLPIIQAAIPIVGFYVVTPLILLCLYFYFHFYLQKLWEELGSLPAVFTDGRLLHNRTDPWLLNDLVRSHFAKLKDGRPFLSYFQAWVSVVIAWWLVPVTLFLFWGRYLRRHDLFWTVFHASLVTLAIFAAVRLYRIANRTLRGEERVVFEWKGVLKGRNNYLRLSFAIGLGGLLIAISLGAVFGDPYWPSGKARMALQMHSPRTWVPWLLDRVGYYPFANLRDADVSVKPPNWTGKKDEELDLVKGANLSGRDLRNADAASGFLVKAQLQNATLRGAHLSDANLRQANLESADLRGADLSDSGLRDAVLTGAHLRGADLRGAGLANTDLMNADLTDAKLGIGPRKILAINENFYVVRTTYPTIKFAKLLGTKGLRANEIKEYLDWECAFYDPGMLEHLGLLPDHNEKLQEQMEAEQKAKAAATAPSGAAVPPTDQKAKPCGSSNIKSPGF